MREGCRFKDAGAGESAGLSGRGLGLQWQVAGRMVWGFPKGRVTPEHAVAVEWSMAKSD
jgi:hypothetical protein